MQLAGKLICQDVANGALQGVDPPGANLKGAAFRGANLEQAVVEDADLSGADFRDTRLRGPTSAAPICAGHAATARIWMGPGSMPPVLCRGAD